MDKKAIYELISKKMDPSRLEDFTAELKKCKNKHDYFETAKRFGVMITEEEKKYIAALNEGAVSDEELTAAAGGGDCDCSTGCDCSCWTG